ncbi:transposase [Endozoicomonas gorgoniicola]|uniref:Transposase n=1 Tax=Endozoicomonas gorgoniicola TaxID=1234144 RepID=A0ABT3MZF7_9GAMM|nr:transposase [Endozoicomonas gorgoniicola]MCW7554764.1 transposase [Endozoicomonas gorgoniicola]
MLQGIRLKANPTDQQRLILSQWMGCARFIWNAKCDEHRYYSTYAKKNCPIGTFAPVDQKAAQFKSKELSPWLYHCPSQIIRNSAVNWYQTYQKHMKGICGKPKRKPKTDKGSVYLTKELFRFDVCEDGVTRLFIGTKTNNIGYLSFKSHRQFDEPKSIYIRKEAGHYFVSFCYDDGSDEPATDKDHFEYLKGASKEWLKRNVIGVDRGVAIPVHTGGNRYDFTDNQKASKEKRERHVKRLQRRLAKQKKGSNRRRETKNRIVRHHRKIANIRNDFCHKTSRKMVDSKAKVIIFEDLKTSNMTRKPKAKKDRSGKFISNKAKQKAGLNKAILNVGWHYLETYIRYKAAKAGKAVFKVPAHHTSQECANCSHTHPDNRKTQELFSCVNCGHVDNADRNASIVIKKRAINLLLDSGTELVGKGIPVLTKGRGAIRKTRKAKASFASGNETSKKKRTVTTAVAA